jgi:cobalamin synthase
MPADLRHAMAALTALPLGGCDPHGSSYARATLFFPVVGLMIGAAMLGLNSVLSSWSHSGLSAVALVALWASASGEWRGPGRPWLPLSWAAKGACLAALGSARPAGLLFAPILGRWGMVVLLTGARDAQRPERKFNPQVTFREFAITSVISGAIVCTLAEVVGVVLYVMTGALLLSLRLITHRFFGGVSERSLAFTVQAIEVLTLALLVGLR